MAGRLQLRRGTTAQNNAFTGAVGELTFDTDTNGVRVHDGHTQGGLPFNTVTAFQRPTAANNYTWYRKWADGWVEQGGYSTTGTYNSPSTTYFPVAMADTNYTLLLGARGEGNYTTSVAWRAKTTTGFTTEGGYNGGNAGARGFNWQVCGMAA